ncbi:MAG: thiamine phosphate synthase [Akkermansiaceae bacterium]|nr:thiamine phosphate synthase [Akkermansiaceae bacterium]
MRKELFEAMTLRERLAAARLYGIVDLGYVSADRIEAVTAELLTGGVDLLQLRAKGCTADQILEFARRLGPICREAGIPFIVNDHPEIATEVGAEGVHIGQDDGSLESVREMVGETMLVGRSTHSFEQAKAAMEGGADYIGFGPLFPTPTKEGRPGIGLEELARAEETVGCRIPMFCIGGIKIANLPEIFSAGARRVVIVSGILRAADVAEEVRRAKCLLAGASD